MSMDPESLYRDALDRLVTARPDALVMEMGVPHSAPVGALYMATHGGSRVCGQAAVEVLTGPPGRTVPSEA